MHTRIRLAVGLLAGMLLGGNVALADTSGQPTDCPKIKAVERIDGTVMNIDAQQGVLTLLGSDGTIHKFQASPETLQDLKIGDKIQTKLRISDRCRRS
jgi:hypothetical protein